MAVKIIKSRWDYPTKEGKYWVLTDINGDFRIVDFSNGKFLDNMQTDTFGKGTQDNFFELNGVIQYQFINKPKPTK